MPDHNELITTMRALAAAYPFHEGSDALKDAATALAELSAKPGHLAVANLIDATENLMAWQVRNVKIWNNSAYDNAALRLQQLRDVSPVPEMTLKFAEATSA